MNKKSILIISISAIFISTLSSICLMVLTITNKTTQTNEILVDEQLLDSYVLEKVKRAQTVALTEDGNRDILVLKDESAYVTYIYQEDGYLWDLYLLASQDFNPDYADKICPLETFELSQDQNFLVVNEDYYLSLEGKL